MPNNTKVNPEMLELFVSSVLQKVGLPQGDAELTAQILVDADLRGIDTHGVINLYDTYVKKLQNGSINCQPEIKISSGSPTTAILDGDNGLGFIVSHKAMNEAISMAKEYGTGWTTVFNSNHSGAGAYYVLMAAKQNMVGVHFSSGGSTVSGPGGKEPLIGNNVMAVAAPAGKYPPFVFDMAPTMVIANKLHKIKWEGEKIPEGFAIDIEGDYITDPDFYFHEGGSILPLGSTIIHGMHKGFGLLLVSDIFTGLLSGNGGSMLRQRGVDSHAFCAINIDAFQDVENFKNQMDAIIEKIHAAPMLDNNNSMRYPGERGDSIYNERSIYGIPLHPMVVEKLQKISKELDVPLENIWYK